jgi:hypothetical protein
VWFRTFLDLPKGLPSHDTFGKVFACLDPDVFEQRIQRWIHALVGSPTEGKHIALDGKTLRQSFDRASHKAAIPRINAYVHENHAVFGQLKVADKTNEITAIPQRLEMLQLQEATVTIEAMGCQRDLAQNLYETTEKSHGRIETRKYWSCWEVDWLIQRHDWPGLSSLVVVGSTSLAAGAKATASNVFQGSRAYGAAKAVDDDPGTRWATDSGVKQAWLELDLGKPVTFGRAAISEEYDRIRQFELQSKDGETWKTFLQGTRIGDRKSTRLNSSH